jgi:hypothetical protein
MWKYPLGKNNIKNNFVNDNKLPATVVEPIGVIPFEQGSLPIDNKFIFDFGEKCEEIEIKKRVYEIRYILNDIGCVVAKSVSNKDRRTIFCLSKYDCRTLGIKYEVGLEVLPSTETLWKPLKTAISDIKKKVELESVNKQSVKRHYQNNDNVSKFHYNCEDGAIRRANFCLQNIASIGVGMSKIELSEGKVIPIDEFINRVSVIVRRRIVGDDKYCASFEEGENVPFIVTHNKIWERGELCFQVDLSKASKIIGVSHDNYIGVARTCPIDEVLCVSYLAYKTTTSNWPTEGRTKNETLAALEKIYLNTNTVEREGDDRWTDEIRYYTSSGYVTTGL